jgi:hypothetical protein
LISKVDFYKIVDLLDSFEKLCIDRNIKFNKFTEEELMQVLMWYKNYKTGDKPPF